MKNIDQQYQIAKGRSENQEDFIGRLLFQLVENSKNNDSKMANLDKTLGNVQAVAIKGDPGDPGYTPQKFVDYFTESEIKDLTKVIQASIKMPLNGIDGRTPVAGRDYPSYEQIENYIKNHSALMPTLGNVKVPGHEWNKEGTRIRFENSDGSWGEWSEILKGKDGKAASFGRGSRGISSFIQLLDAPDNYIGKAGDILQVKGDESGLEFTKGLKITAGFTPPASPSVGDLWIDMN